MVQEDILNRIHQNNAKGEEIVQFIEEQIPLLKKSAIEKYTKKLALELSEKNDRLKRELAYWLSRVTELEKMIGIEQYSLPCNSTMIGEKAQQAIQKDETKTIEEPMKNIEEDPNRLSKTEVQPENQAKKATSKKEKKEKPIKAEKAPTEDNQEVNVSRLDLRIGRILSAKKHPEADSLYVEEIDIGEEKPRTVVSGLVKFVPLEEMQNRMVVVLCNLKPAKMRGITSEAMVMCASTPDKVEILLPPPASVPGDRVTCEEYPGQPDALLPPKKKIFEQVAPDLKTNAECIATYKSAKLIIVGKGELKSASLTNVQIK